jgi:NTE family protein
MRPLTVPSSIGSRMSLVVGVAILCFVPMMSAQTASSGEVKGRALVLGGGGPVGEAWESGIIAGLKDRGINLANADLIVGTSAGAIVGARLAGRMPSADFIDAALAPSDGPPASGQATDNAPSGPRPDLSFLARKLEEMGAAGASLQLLRREIGEWALKVHPVVSEEQFIASYRRRFPNDQWPGHNYQCVTIDAGGGSLRVWNEASGVPLALAVASSCALPGVFAPVTIDGHHFMDGGVRSVTNADLARGCRTALVLAPTMGLADPLAKSFTHPLSGELRTLIESGCKVELIAPDAASLAAFSPSVGDENHRKPAFDAGRMEGQTNAGKVAAFWND